jgi:hypothetical protein
MFNGTRDFLHRIACADEFEIYPTVLSTDKSD